MIPADLTPGHYLFRVLQEGKYFAAVRGAVRFDYWDELPAERRQQYERSANSLIQCGIEEERGKHSPKPDPDLECRCGHVKAQHPASRSCSVRRCPCAMFEAVEGSRFPSEAPTLAPPGPYDKIR